MASLGVQKANAKLIIAAVTSSVSHFKLLQSL